ncbi:MAG: hypothetical protein ABJZ55_11525 [Fuerstiella sp.]
MMVETYRHSGRIGPLGIPLMVIGGLVSAIILGAIYAYGLAWIPLIYAALALTAGLGAGIGFVVGTCGKLGNVRNPLIIGIFGLLAGLVGLATAWCFDATAKFPEDIQGPILDAQTLERYVKSCYENGTWGLGNAGAAVSGVFLGCVWAAEALTILGLSFVVARMVTASTPFCEQCMKWTSLQGDYARLFPPENDNSAVDSLCNGDVASINQFTKAPASAGAYLRLDVAECGACDQCNCVSVALAEVTEDKNGDHQINTTLLTEHMMLPGEAMTSLKEQVDQLEVASTTELSAETEQGINDDDEEQV